MTIVRKPRWPEPPVMNIKPFDILGMMFSMVGVRRLLGNCAVLGELELKPRSELEFIFILAMQTSPQYHNCISNLNR